MSVVLYDFWRSSASYRVRIALNMKGIEYQSVQVDLAKGEQGGSDNVARNPQGFAPTLEIDGHRLVQSLAIIDYLDARVEEPRLLPSDPAARSRVLAMALVVAADIHPIQNLRILKFVEAHYGADRAEWSKHWITEGFAALEVMAGEAGEYLSGDAPGLADICLVPQMYNARRFGVEVDTYPTLARIDATLTALPAFAAAAPEAVRPTV